MTYGAPAAPGDLTQPQGSTAVFVDASGRRWRRVRWLGVALAGLLVAYLLLLVAALVGPPALSRIAVPGLGPVLPGPAAGSLGDGRGGSATPREALVRSSLEPAGQGAGPTPIPSAGTPTTTGPTPGGPVPAPAAPPAPEPPSAPAASAPPRPAPAATPSAGAPSAGQPTVRPTPSREPAPASTGGRPSEQPSPAAGRPSEPPGQPDREPGATGASTTDRPSS